MAKRLYRLGGWAFDHRRRVLAFWVFAVLAVGVSAAAFSGQTNNKFEVPGTESQEAQELLNEKMPGAGGASAKVVFEAPEGQTLDTPEHKAAIEDTIFRAEAAEDVTMAVSPYEGNTFSKDRRIAYAEVVYPVPSGEIADSAREDLAEVGEPAEEAGLTVEYGGGIVSEESESSAESTGMMIGYLVLAITLGSLLAAGLPLLTAIIGVVIGVGGLHALSGTIDLSETAPILATMLGLAVGIDYALFILSRHRQNMEAGMDVREAAAQATATAGSAVVFAGATVVIALVGLLVVGIPFLNVMGLAAAGTVSIAVVIALTLLPALLGFAGLRVSRLNRVLGRRTERQRAQTEKLSTRWARFVTRRPLAVLGVGLSILVVVAIPATHLELGLPDGGSQPETKTERRAYDLLTEGFGPGFNGQLTAVVDAPNRDRNEQRAIAQNLSEGLEEFPGVAAVSPAIQNEAGDVTIVNVTPTTSPASQGTEDLVNALRAEADRVHDETGIDAFVTGQTALNIDTSDRLNEALPSYILVVVGLALLLLMVVFRSIVVPVKAAAGFLISIAASMGLVVWVFQDGNLAELFGVATTGPIVSFLPVLLIGILFGLAMDYEVFLVSRMREAYVHSGKPRESIVTGFTQSGRVVVAAALIMIGVFGGFVLAEDPITKSIGLSLAFGVLVDAFVVRMTLVPAVMAVVGHSAWHLPRWLDRVLPNLDIEGEGLADELKTTAPARAPAEAEPIREPALH